MIKVKKIKPMFTSIVVTAEKYTKDTTIYNSALIDSSRVGAIKEYQKVVAIGDSVRGIKVGDLVEINPERFAVKKHNEGSLKNGIVCDNPTTGYNFPTVVINETTHLLLQDRDIAYIIEEYTMSKAVDKEPLIKSEAKESNKIALPRYTENN